MKKKTIRDPLASTVASRLEGMIGSYANAWAIIRKVTGLEGPFAISNDKTINADQLSEILSIGNQIVAGKPVQYALGTIPFLNCTLEIKAPILIPRPETEEWVARLVALMGSWETSGLKILDLCTGSGCIGIALAKEFPSATVVGVDIADEALELATTNSKLNKTPNFSMIQSDLYSSLGKEKFDLIVANPPYLSQTEWETTLPGVKLWEDKQALIGGRTGLELTEEIIIGAKERLSNRQHNTASKMPNLVLEIDSNRGKETIRLMETAGFTNVNIWIDFLDRNRTAVGRL